MQLDLFGAIEAELAAAHSRAAWAQDRNMRFAAFLAFRRRRPDTGADLGQQVWCGRCGATVRNAFFIDLEHEMGWVGGCYLDFRPGALRHRYASLSTAQRADRWDRQFFPDCANCTHPWGLHPWHTGGGSFIEHLGCQAHLMPGCSCPGYLAPDA